METIPFIDLKAQYQALRGPIGARIQAVLEHGQFILGPEHAELESRLAEYVGVRHALAVSSGTDAAVIAMMALGIGPGDEVIVPAFSFIATAEAVVLCGATPVFVDVEADSFNLAAGGIERALTPKTRAIQPVSLYGQTADMDALAEIAARHGLVVIEDGAQSFGATYRGRRSGALARVGVTSFFPAKPLGGYGDGGAIFTDDDGLADAMREIRVHGQSERYVHARVGVNGRLDTLQCAILLPKLERFPWELGQRQARADRYHAAFADLAPLGLHVPRLGAGRTSAWAQYTLRVPGRRDAFQEFLKSRGVPTSVHYPRTMADQPAYAANARVSTIDTARALAREVVSLPIYPDMTDRIQDRVIAAARDFFVAKPVAADL